MLRTRVGLPAILTLLASSSLAAQAVSDSVPREFAEVVLGGMGPGNSFVGTLPPELDGVLPLLPDGRTVGASHNVAVIAFAAAPDTLMRRYEEALEAAGWTKAPPREMEGGFVRADLPSVNLWCSSTLSISPSVRRVNDRSYLRISFYPRERSICNAEVQERRPRMAFAFDLPTLVPPPGVTNFGGGRSGSDRSAESSTELHGPSSPSVLAEHFQRQLTEVGWTPTGRAEGDGIAVRRYDAPGAEGEPWTGLLMLWQGEGDVVYARLQVTRPVDLGRPFLP